VDENTFIVNGTMSLVDFEDFFGTQLPIGKYNTLSGFIIDQIGKIPDKNDKIILEIDNLVIKIEETGKKVVSKVKVCKINIY